VNAHLRTLALALLLAGSCGAAARHDSNPAPGPSSPSPLPTADQPEKVLFAGEFDGLVMQIAFVA
jgi:hypothetical protein